MKTCESFEDRLDAFHDDELDQTARDAVRAHVATCAACAQRLEELAALREFVTTHGAAAAPAELRDRIVAASAAPGPSYFSWLGPRLLAAALGGLAVSGAWLIQDRGPGADRTTRTVDYLEPAAATTKVRRQIAALSRQPIARMLEHARNGGLDR